MLDPELNDDKNLKPYQRELFPKKRELPGKQLPPYKSRGQIHGFSRNPFNTISEPEWLQKPSGKVHIEYFEE